MATYDFLFDGLGLRGWCDAGKTGDGPLSMADLLAKGGAGKETPWWELPFPSLDALNEACGRIAQSRDTTKGLEQGFLAIKDALRFVLDPLTQPLSWILEFALLVFEAAPWWVMFPLLMVVVYLATRSIRLIGLVTACLGFLAFIDHYGFAMQTLAIIFVCAFLCVPVRRAHRHCHVAQRPDAAPDDPGAGHAPDPAAVRVPDPSDLPVLGDGAEALRNRDHPLRDRAG